MKNDCIISRCSRSGAMKESLKRTLEHLWCAALVQGCIPNIHPRMDKPKMGKDQE